MQEHQRFQRVAQDAELLEDQKRNLWHQLHPLKRRLNDKQLHRELEARARAEQATKEDKDRLAILDDLREKRAILLNFREHASSHVLHSKPLPENPPRVQVRETSFPSEQRLRVGVDLH